MFGAGMIRYCVGGGRHSALDNDTLAILKAPEVIAVNQDALGIAGDLVWKQGPAEVRALSLSAALTPTAVRRCRRSRMTCRNIEVLRVWE